APGGNLVLSMPGASAAQQTHAVYDDSGADNPYGIEITQESFVNGSPNDDYVIMRFILNNTSGVSITGLRFGILADWDATNYNANAGGYDATDEITWQAYDNGSVLADYRGIKLINGTLATAGVDSSKLIWAIDAGGNGFPDSDKYLYLTSGFTHADANKTSRYDLFSIVAAGPITLDAGARDTVTFALLAGDTYPELQDAGVRALDPTPVDDPTNPPDNLPVTFEVYQNYPNPFNPATTISFDMPYTGSYRLSIINALGQTVDEQTGEARVGPVTLEWDGSKFASGPYFYRVTVGDYSKTRKMMLLK
ncbi:MAG: T9SS type A sorting domain-containing protein, partial [candidate division Zixibacteria bacterium]|nr:T9SS type A sorting domain-containing protein [candidate division Zixibacteria bacterium]